MTTFDTSVAHIARVYNYWLGGTDNFAADRKAAEEGIRAYPQIVSSVRANRAFLARAVRFLVQEKGIRQFLDLGTGIPTAGNTHEVAQSLAPDARVVYVDNDPIVLAHAQELLASTPEGACDYIDADLRDTATILDLAACTLDFSQPVAVMLIAVLHCISGDPRGVVTRLLDAVVPNSYLALTHPASDIGGPSRVEMQQRVNALLPGHITHRGRAEVTGFFAGLEVLDPGVVLASQWHPATELEASAHSALWAGVGRKPG
jgi:trans-aconitate methyltransferase